MSFCEDEPYLLHMTNVHHKNITLEELKKDEGDGSSGMEMEQQELENEDGEGMYSMLPTFHLDAWGNGL
jgi:hypothetical protein